MARPQSRRVAKPQRTQPEQFQSPGHATLHVQNVPYIPASQVIAEVTIKGVILGIVLAIILGAANTYLGLKAGLTVSASIPAAVISMGVLRLFRKSTVLENNMVQTIASAGEAVAGGILFTIPALLIIGYWKTVGYWETTTVAVVGGILGVLFTVPLRRALIIEENLAFPEGVATAEVLKTGDRGGSGVGYLVAGGIMGAIYKFVESGLNMWSDTTLWVQNLGNKVLYGIGTSLSPALVGVGYIVGLRIATLVFGGGVIGWLIAMPLYSLLHNGDLGALQADNLADTAGGVWSHEIRYLGVGAMLVGGIWSLIKLRKPLTRAMKQGIGASKNTEKVVPIRTEQELSARTTFLGVGILLVPMFLFYAYISRDVTTPAGAASPFIVAALMSLIMVVTGFFFSAVGAYMAGLVGSSNNPISGVTILTLIMSAFTLKLLGLGADIGPAVTIFIAAVIAVAGSIASDNLQDLKAGYMLGATPRKQQYMLMIGAVAAAFVLAPVLQILVNGAGGPSGLGSTSLPAPQSGLMASVSQGIFGAGLPYDMIGIGALLAVGMIIADIFLGRAGAKFRIPVMAVAVGIYLPITVTAPIFVGGLVAWAVGMRARRKYGVAEMPEGSNMGILMSSGLIAGEAIIGIVTSGLAGVGIFLLGRNPANEPLKSQLLAWPGLLLLLYIAGVLYYGALRPYIIAKRKAA